MVNEIILLIYSYLSNLTISITKKDYKSCHNEYMKGCGNGSLRIENELGDDWSPKFITGNINR